jgi:transcriptional regulator with XRE-family HTH domain
MRNRIKQLREERGLTQEAVASQLGLHLTNYNKLENGKTELTTTRLEKLASIFGVEPLTILSAETPVRVVHVQGAVKAGAWAESWELPEEDQYDVPIPDDRTFAGMLLFGAEARGPSMDKVYPDGSVIIFTDQVQRGEEPIIGKRYVVERERSDGLREHTVKTLWRDGAGRMWLLPESSDPLFQTPISLEAEEGETVRILGRVVYSVRRE